MSTREVGFGWPSGVVSTVGAATSNVCTSAALPSNCTFSVRIELLGRDTTLGSIANTSLTHRGKVVAGVVTLTGTLTSLVSMVTGSDAALATASAALVVVGSTIQLQATGVAAITIEWFGDMYIRVN